MTAELLLFLPPESLSTGVSENYQKGSLVLRWVFYVPLFMQNDVLCKLVAILPDFTGVCCLARYENSLHAQLV